MQKFTYSYLMRLLYRYGNIPVTIILLFYLVGAVSNLDRSLINLIPLGIAALLLYFLNRHYLTLYKILPYTIVADKEKLTCSDFSFSNKSEVIYYKDIDKLTGGVFEAKITSFMKIYDGKRSVCIGFFTTISNSKTLQTIILSKIDKNLYDEIITKLKGKKEMMQNKGKDEKVHDENKSKVKKGKSKK